MAFTDPQVVTINAIAKSMPRVTTEANASLYSTADEEVKMRISHQTVKDRTRRMVRIDQRVVAADPLAPTVNAYKSLGVYLVIDEPEYGFTDTAIDYVVQGFKTWLSTGNVLKVLGSES